MPARVRDLTFDGLDAIEIVHGGARLILVHAIGPRIAWFGRAGGDNLLFWDEDGAHARGPWKLRGGHRVWVTRPGADESEETYAADDSSCRVRRSATGVVATAPPDAHRLERSIVVRPRPGGFVVESRVRNASDMLWSGGVWALTCTRPRRRTTYGIPLGSDAPAWDAFSMVVPRRWGGVHTSRVADPQIRFTEDCLVLHPRGVESKRMIEAPRGLVGMTEPEQDLSFLKRAAHDPTGVYPLRTNVALYVGPRNFMVEMETMGPQVTLPPGATLAHAETWSLERPIDWSAWRPPAVDRGSVRPARRAGGRR